MRTVRVGILPDCAAAVILAAACASDAGSRAEPTFLLHEDPASLELGVIEVANPGVAALELLGGRAGPDESWTDVLDVRVPGGAQPVAGRYEVLENRLRFVPRFPPMPDQPWAVRYTVPGGGPSIDTVLRVSAQPGAMTRITAVYPVTDTVPMNLLRAYIRFSAPMSEGEAYERIRLLDASGEPVPDAFLILEHELWDAERTRFTLLFDPGRIKRGLVPNEELGLPLNEGNTYTLVVDGGWTDSRGRPLAAGHTWTFHAGPVDRVSPRVEAWSIAAPAAATRDALRIDVGEPLDQALFERLLTVRDAADNTVAGDVRVSADGSRWTFVPADPWTAGIYTLAVGTELEDLAGNNLRHLFDVDRNDRQDTGITGEVVRVPITIR